MKMLKINGETAEAIGVTVEAHLKENGYSTDRVAVMVNGEILPKSDYAAYKFADGDEVDIVGFVGGG